MDERRQLPRWEIKKDAKVWMPQTQSFSHGVIENMHLKGMCLSFDRQVFQEQETVIYFTIGDNFDLIRVEARIPWESRDHDRHMYGLSFTQIRDDYKDKIDQYITANCYNQLQKKWWERQGPH
jgi:PilZ domain